MSKVTNFKEEIDFFDSFVLSMNKTSISVSTPQTKKPRWRATPLKFFPSFFTRKISGRRGDGNHRTLGKPNLHELQGSEDNGVSTSAILWREDLEENWCLHPGRLTWNLQIIHLERKMIFQTSMIMFHVNLQGCIDFLVLHVGPGWMLSFSSLKGSWYV